MMYTTITRRRVPVWRWGNPLRARPITAHPAVTAPIALREISDETPGMATPLVDAQGGASRVNSNVGTGGLRGEPAGRRRRNGVVRVYARLGASATGWRCWAEA